MTIKDSTSYLFFLFLSLAISLTAFQYMSSVLGQINTLTEKEEASQSGNQTLHITKVATNSYTIASGASFIGSFNTTYHVVGGVESMDVSEDLIISTITQDFDALPAAGYVNDTSTSSRYQVIPNERNLPNPFATKGAIVEKIRSEIATSIENAAKSDIAHGEIECIFGSSLNDFRCSFHG
jgi:hypothetical protein